ncbi:MAG: flavin reductase family protein [Alphaproteobacteria bacterium]|nr:flavin reductase family protein [Alphaproteobacteria bacterium]
MSEYYSYTPAEGHGLKYSPFKALVAPRPIGWITTVSATGAVNLAPYSFFNAMCELPPIVAFSSAGVKHTLENLRATGEFVCNLVSMEQAGKMNLTSGEFDAGVNEMAEAGLDVVASQKVAPPRVAGAPGALECKVIETRRLTDAAGTETNCWMTLGEVVRVHMDTQYMRDGMFDTRRAGLVARGGYRQFTHVATTFEMTRPDVGAAKGK